MSALSVSGSRGRGATIRGAAARAALAAVVASAVSSCASTVKAPPGVEPERLLPPGAVAYARLDGPTLAAVLERAPGSTEADKKAAAAIAARTDALTLAVVRNGSSLGLVGVAEGSYPRGAAALGLSADRSWKRAGPVWERGDGSLRLAFASDGRAFVGTAPLDQLLAAAKAPNAFPIPERWAAAWSESVSVYLPDPAALLSEKVPLGDAEVPLTGMLLSARPAKDGSYEAILAFEFGTTRAATVFSPLCRIFLYAAAHSLWPERAATVLDSARWAVSGTAVTAAGLPLDAASLGAFAAVGFR